MTQSFTLTAVIRETDCIGCTKCIQACPVDAILGSHQLMHTVITEECIGCKLCVSPCPVDCIDMVKLSQPLPKRPQFIKNRYQARRERLAREITESPPEKLSLAEKKDYIYAAIQRKQAKK